MDAPLADILLLSLALVTFAGLIALAKVFEKVTAESAKTARITDPSAASNDGSASRSRTDSPGTSGTDSTSTGNPDTRGGAQA